MKFINTDYKEQKISFLGKRTDKNIVNELTTESGALYKPKQRAISEALVRLSFDGSSENINFLFSVAENLNYGLRKNSGLSGFVNKASYITAVPNKQNNDWEAKIKKALADSIAKNKTAEAVQFKERFESFYGDEKESQLSKSVVNSPLTTRIKKEKELVKLRNDILNSDAVKQSPEDIDKKKLYKNLDYFIASSEVALGEKIECLKIIKHITSPQYKTNPQLTEHKLQIISEIMTDLVIENPNQAKLLSKEISQRTHGMCAAISISRKAIPHEHKLAFVSTMAAELDDKFDIEIYDVTSKDFSKKIRVPKADIDYKQALKEGYRITDAAVTNWMHIADTYGDGSQKYKWFKPFDGENYGIFRDSHLQNDLEGVNKSKQYTLRSLIKIKKKGEEVEKIRNDYKKAVAERKSVQENLILTTKRVNENTRVLIQKLAKVSDSEAKKIADNILDVKYLQEIRKPFISQYTKAEQLENAKSILVNELDCKNNPNLDGLAKSYVLNYIELGTAIAEKTNNDMKMDMFSPENSQKIFDYAAYTRVKTEYELDIPEKLEEKAKLFGIENNDDAQVIKARVLKKMENAGIILKREDLDEMKSNSLEKLNLERKGKQDGNRASQKAADKMRNVFTPHQMEMLKKVERNFAQSYREVKKEYLAYAKDLAPELEKVYADGKYGGYYWIQEEGASGLGTSQQMRLIEQISGKEHYSENNVTKAMDHIEQAKGAGVLASSVSDKDAAFHAQYIYDIDARYAKNPHTDVPEVQRVLFTDNSWGPCEMKTSYKPEVGRNFWKDSEGNTRTDYGRSLGGEFGDKDGFGYKHGFFVDKNFTVGVSEEDMVSSSLTFSHKVGNKPQEMSFPLFSQAIVRGNNAQYSDFDSFVIQQSLYSAISQKSLKEVNSLVNAIKAGNIEDISCLTKDLKKHLMPRISFYAESNPTDLENMIKEDIKTVVLEYPTTIFKSEGKEKFANPEIFMTNLAKNLFAAVQKFKDSDKDEIQKQCILTSETVSIIEAAILKDTTPIYKPHYDEFETVKEKFQRNSKEFLEKFRTNAADSINTKEELEALPEDGKTKLTLKKAALFERMYNLELSLLAENSKIADAVGFSNIDYDIEQSTFSERDKATKVKGLSLDDIRVITDKIIVAKNSSDLQGLEDDFRKLTEDQIIIGFDKSLLEKMKKVPNTFADLKNIPGSKMVIDFIDAKYNPANDSDLMQIYSEILDKPKAEQENIVRNSKDSEVNFQKIDYYNFAQRIRGEEKSAEDCVQSIVVYDALTKEFGLKSPFKEGASKADKLFMSLSNAMAYADVINWIGKNKAKAFNDYHAYPSIPLVKAFSDKEVEADNQDMVQQLKEVVIKINEYKKAKTSDDADIDAISDEIEHEKSILRERVRIIANSCIQPRYVKDVVAKMNEYFSEMGRNPESEKARASEKALLEMMSKYHITNTPQVLFKSFIKDVTEENDYGSVETRNNIVQLKSIFLTKICNAADKSKLEFDLITANQNGRMSSIARDLKSSRFGVAQAGKAETLPWNSNQVIELVVAQLRDDNNKNQTLKHFLTSTGMTSDAINGLIKGPSPSKHLSRVQGMKDILDQFILDQKELDDKYTAWISSNKLTAIQKNSVNIDDVKIIVNEYLESVKPNNKKGKNAAYINYKEMIQGKLEMMDYSGVRMTAEDFLSDVHKEFMNSQEDAKEDTIEKIIMHQRMLGEKITTLTVISSLLKEGGSEKAEVEKYIKNATDCVQEMEKLKDTFQQSILDKIMQQAEVEKAENQRRKKALEAAQGTTVSKDNCLESIDIDKQAEEAQNMYSEFLEIQKTNSEMDIKLSVYGIIHSDNPEVTGLLVKTLNDESSTDLSKAYAVRCLIEKKEFEPLKDYLQSKLFKNEITELDDTAINCVDGIIVGSIFKTGEEKEEYLSLISKALEVACDKNYQSDNVYVLMSQLRNTLANKSAEINNILLDKVFDKNASENVRAISMDILSRSNSGEFKQLMEDVVVNSKKYASNPDEEFTFFDVCLLGLKNIKLMNPEAQIKIKDELKNMNLSQIVDNGMKSAPIEAKASKEDDFRQRIEYILSDNPVEKYIAEHNADDTVDQQQLYENPKANTKPVPNFIKYRI